MMSFGSFVLFLLVIVFVGTYSHITTTIKNDDCIKAVRPFVKIGTKCYFIEMNKKVNWFEALHICRTHNAHLASIESEAEEDALNEYIIAKNDHKLDDQYWLSGNDLDSEGEYFWFGTGKRMVYSKWHTKQPDDAYGNEDCVEFGKFQNTKEFRMNDMNCKELNHFICEASNPKTISFVIS